MTRRFYGSLQNRLEEGKQTEAPFVGMGATMCLYSDRHAYTVQKVISPSRVIVTADQSKRTDTNGQSDCQHYEYTSTPLEEGTRCKMCCNSVIARLQAQFPEMDVCAIRQQNGTCEGCEDYKMHTPSNGIELRKTSRGWKVTGQDVYFILGVREEYYDFSF